MFSFFKRRAFLRILGFVLIAVFIWFAGPYFAFASYAPLETVTARLIAIALIIGLWLASVLLKRIRAFRASGQLMSAVLKQPQPEEGRPSAEAVNLRERFEEAVATLQQQHREKGQSLYDLPWYIIIGAPGAGKSTALVNSGLKFAPSVAKGALRGVGGTRNCDWWFTDEAVFLDTAGRYTTQDSDAASDSTGWREFLALLRKYRGRRPINGVILAVSAQDLMTQGDTAWEAHVDAARRRLRELNRELRIQLPIYLMVTKCDLVAGFTEYFGDFAQDARAQVWGVTFPYEQTLAGAASGAFPAEFDALVSRLSARLFARVEEERDVRRRTMVFAFPQQVAFLRDRLVSFVDELFASTRAGEQALLRGVYFTSGTQEGTPIDRVLAAIGGRFGLSDAVAPTTGRGKSYFVERLLKEVMIGESGLAGVDRRTEMRKAAMQLGAYAAMGLVAVAGVTSLSVSYGRNRAYVAEVAAAVSTLKQVPPVSGAASIEAIQPRLAALRDVAESANKYRSETPWAMRWGLYQGTSIGNAARDAYLRELDALVLPRFAARVKERLVGYASEPEALCEYLKAYLMLDDPKHLDKKHLQAVADLEWDATTDTAVLAKHFQSLLDDSDALPPIALDPVLVAQARNTIRQASVPRIAYGRIKRRYAGDVRVVRLDVAAGLGAEQVMQRKSGATLSTPVPGLYSRPVFQEITRTAGMAGLIKELSDDDWVWGGSGMPVGNPAKLAFDVIDVYERDYIAAWDGILSDLEIRSFSTVQATADALAILAGPTSPLRNLLAAVVNNTSLVEAPVAQAPSGALSSAASALTDRLGQLSNAAKAAKEAAGISRQPGALVAAHFQPYKLLMEGAPGSAPIDGVLGQLATIQQQLKAMGPEVGGTDPVQALSSPALHALFQSLQERATTLPPAISALVVRIGQRAEGSVQSRAGGDLEGRYQQQVLAPCAAAVAGRYPFEPSSSTDVLLDDFARVFGYGGLFDKFFTGNNLEGLIDRQSSPWTWRPGAGSLSRDMLAQIEAAQRLREMFFRPGSERPQVGFTVSLTDVDAATTRFVLEVDGQTGENKHQGVQKWPMKWPGSVQGRAVVTFEDVASLWPPRGFEGPWAWFRLIDAGQPRRESDRRLALTFQNIGHRGSVVVEPDSIRNPFTDRGWQRASCGR